MATELVDEDNIDTEALQAQIDLSMSFAQNLISTWMEPQKLPTSSRRQDLEKELTEYMKRPPKLGVGASVPEGHQNMSRDTARLRGKLAGTKRPREETNEMSIARAPSDDDEGESRAGAIKKKARPDPFDVTHGKKKKKPQDSHPSPEKPKYSGTSSATLKPESGNTNVKPPSNADTQVEQSPSKKKKKRKNREVQEDNFPTPIDNIPSPQAPPTPIGEDLQLPILTETQPLSLESANKTGPISPTTSTTLSSTAVLSQNPVQTELLKRPLLNLTGPPPSDDESDPDPTESPTTSPRKKRRRRKKKKHHLPTLSTEDPVPQASEV